MDKYEYRVKLAQIEKLVAKKDYVTAASIADGIDWRKIKSVTTLNMIADIYEATNRLEDCYEILNMVYDRSPIVRRVVFRMAEVALKMRDYEEAVELYKEFVKIAPHDLGRYVLKYQIYRERGSSVEEQIPILEEYKSHEYDEHWAYELACLYEEAGRIDQCIEECDELILWFSEGEYVIKAMELKMKYQELTASQQDKYERRFEMMEPEVEEELEDEEDLAEELKETETIAPEVETAEVEVVEAVEEETADEEAAEFVEEETVDEEAAEPMEEDITDVEPDAEEEDDTPQVSEVNVNKFSTINLQAELAKGLQELLEKEASADKEKNEVEEAFATIATTQEFVPVKEVILAEERSEVTVIPEENEAAEEAAPEEREQEMAVIPEESLTEEAIPEENTVDTTATEEECEEQAEKTLSDTAELHTEILKYVAVAPEEKTEPLYCTDEDGQMSLVIGPEETPEKQITGQLTIEEILEAWEEKKRQAREKIEVAEKEAVLYETGEITGLLADFIPTTPKDVQEIIEEIEAEEVAVQELEECPVEAKEAEVEPIEETAEAEPAEEIAEAEPVEEILEVELMEELEEAPEEIMEDEWDAPVEVLEEQELEDDLPQDIDLESLLEESLLETVNEEEPEEVNSNTGIGQNTASMLDAIERALALEIAPVETSGKYLTEEEEQIFAYFTSVGGMKKQLASLLAEEKHNRGRIDSQKGNLIITGHPGNGKTTLAIDIVKAIQKQRGVKGGKLAKISGERFSKKNPQEVVEKLCGGSLIIERAGCMKDDAIEKLSEVMEGNTEGLLVILEDSSEEIDLIMKKHPGFAEKFDRSVNIPIFSNDELVAFGKSYAEEQEFYFEEMAVLALYDSIGVRQTSDHVVNVAEVKEIIDEAVRRAVKRNKSFFARFSRRRLDEYGNKLLLEEDFDF